MDEPRKKKKSKKSIDVPNEGENEFEDKSNEKESNKNIQVQSDKEKGKSTKSEKNELTGKSLRITLQYEHAFEIVRKFVTVCNENKNYDLAADYLHEGGSVSEVLKTFDTTDKKNINNITTLFSAIHILIMK